MKISDTISRAGRSLKQSKGRTLLTSLAIGVGAFTITLALAAGEGGRQYANDIVTTNTDVREIYVQPAQAHSTDPLEPQEYIEGPSMQFGGGYTQKMLSGDDMKTLKETAKVKEVTPIYNASAEYITREGQKKYQAGLGRYNSAVRLEVVAGQAADLKADEVILPENFVSVLGLGSSEKAVGKTVDIALNNMVTHEQKIYQKKIAAVTKSSVLQVNSGGVSLQLTGEAIEEMSDFIRKGSPLEGAFLGAVVMAETEEDVEGVKKALTDKGYLAQSAEDLMGFIFQFINVLMGILIGFGALAVLTSVFGIINTQYISVLERTQQIGLMKALGMRRRDVGRLFKFEAAWIGFLGGVLGSSLALLAGTLANPWISETLGIGESHLLIFQPLSFVIIIGGLMLVAIASGIFPSRKAAKLDPIEALRTE